jgi:hypothetical protein
MPPKTPIMAILCPIFALFPVRGMKFMRRAQETAENDAKTAGKSAARWKIGGFSELKAAVLGEKPPSFVGKNTHFRLFWVYFSHFFCAFFCFFVPVSSFFDAFSTVFLRKNRGNVIFNPSKSQNQLKTTPN